MQKTIPRRQWLWLVVFIVLWGGLLRIPYCFHTLQDIDESSHAANAATMLDGGRIYVDAAADNKPPGVFAVYYLVFLLCGKYNMFAVHIATFLCVLATALVLSLLAYKISGVAAALLTLLFYVTFTVALYPGMLAANTEIFMVLPYSLAALLLWLAVTGEKCRLWLYILSGIAAGTAPLFKQVGGVELVAVLLYLLLLPLFSGKRSLAFLKSCAVFCAGFAIPVAVVCLVFYREGVLQDAVLWTITYPNRYIGQGTDHLNFLTQLLENFVPFVLSMPLIWIFCILWIKRSTVATESREYLEMRRCSFHIFLILWLAASVAATLVGKRMFGHYFIQVLPPLCLTSALGAVRYFSGDGTRSRRWRTFTIGFTVFLGVLFTGMSIYFEAATDTWGGMKPDFRPATEYIKANTHPDDRIFVWGWFPQVYVYAERTPATRFAGTAALTGYMHGTAPDESTGMERDNDEKAAIPEAWPMLMADMERNRPVFVIDTARGDYKSFGRYPLKNFPRLRTYVNGNCHREIVLAEMDIYRCGN
jgi:hypothetical protein